MSRFIDDGVASDPLRRRIRRLTLGERIEEAKAFVDLFHHEQELDDRDRRRRRAEVAAALRRTGHYDHTPEELAFGARVAWRNNARCIGRLFWKSLDVFDCRTIVEPEAMAGQIVEHLSRAVSDGRVRSSISIFAPVKGARLPAYVENAQIVQFAGYVGADGEVLGDPLNAEITRTALSLGWEPPAVRGPFDVLPLILRDRDGRRMLFELPPSAYRLIDLRHPASDAFADLGLKWYSVPVVSDMILTIGGVDYPCAPFNGFYLATEIASRDLLDEYRYDLLSRVGQVFSPGLKDPLWKDIAATELNRAVLHSFAAARVSILDHHVASEQFLEFVHAEHACSRSVSADWAWIVPPQASATCPVFHMPMTDLGDVPNFYRSRASDGAILRVNHREEERTRLQNRTERLVRRLRNWRRRRYR